MKSTVIMMFSFLVPVSGAMAGTLEAQKDGVEVYASGDKKSAVVTKLKKGDTVASSERSGMYWQVKTKDGKSGFVSVLAVRAKTEGKNNLKEAMRDAAQQGRSAATADGGRSRSSVMGVRGLDDTSDTGMASSVKPNMIAVYAMEDFELSANAEDRQADLVMSEVSSRMSKAK